MAGPRRSLSIACTAWLAVLAVAQDAAPTRVAEPDRDSDGLSDFAEIHKHLTDPASADSDGDGRPDGDWEERREFAYTVRSVVRLLPPVSEGALTDDQQDGRILRRSKEFIEIEVVHYPLNTAGQALVADPNWRKTIASRRDLKEYLASTTCSNFDRTMTAALTKALSAAGVEVAQADDRSLVEATAKWLLENVGYQDGFTTFCFEFDGREARVARGLEGRVDAELARSKVPLDEQLQRELFAKGMFERRVRGSCTSSAILWCASLRAVGIPTRVVLHIPLVDASDPQELGWVASRLTHHRVRGVVSRALLPLTQSWSSHTMVEVFVGGRWRLLNYGRLGQPSLDVNYFGLLTHVATLRDWADADAARTIGQRQCGPGPTEGDPFGHRNPYSCVELDDRFGEHARIDNPVAPDHVALTIDRVVWWADRDSEIDMRLDDASTAGHLLVHVAESFDDEGSSQYAQFFQSVDREFVLRATDRADVRLRAERGWFFDSSSGLRDFYLRIPPEEVAKLAVGVPYALVPLNAVPGRRWAVADGLSVTRTNAESPFERPHPPADKMFDPANGQDDAKMPATWPARPDRRTP